MMEHSSFFNSIAGDRKYKAEEWAEYFSSFIGNGVFPYPSVGLQVLANNSMTVTVKPGKGWYNGYFYYNDSDLAVKLDTADGVRRRIDRIVMRWDLFERNMRTVYKKGTPAVSAVPPALQRDADAYEQVLADIVVEKGATSITQSKITDQRYNSSLCGIVAGVVTQIDASTLTAQFTAFFAEYSARVIADYNQFVGDTDNFFRIYRELTIQHYENFLVILNGYKIDSRAEYDALLRWFDSFKVDITNDATELIESIRGILSGDIAGQLAAAVLDLQNRVTVLEDKVLHGNLFTTKAWLGGCYLGAAYMTTDTGKDPPQEDAPAWFGNSYMGAAYLAEI